MSSVVGIDLGTTNSLVAYVKDGLPVVIRDESGDALVPSVVSVGEDGTIFVGREAQRRLLTAPASTVYSVRRKAIAPLRISAAICRIFSEPASRRLMLRTKTSAKIAAPIGAPNPKRK